MEKTNIVIIGLGQIGTSIGLALQPHAEHFLRVGHTREYGRGNQVKAKGAIDKVAINLPLATSEADVIVLALPFDQVGETLDIVAADLKEGVVILDTSPAPSGAIALAQQKLGNEANFIAFTPVLSPEHLVHPEAGIDGADAALFARGVFVITSATGVSSEALNFAGDFAAALQATPMFASAVEIDSYMAAIHLLPQLLAASLTNTSADAPGWGELRKVAGRPFAQVTNVALHSDRAAALAAASLASKEHVLRVLDELIAELGQVREQLAQDQSGAMAERLEAARERRATWIGERRRAEWLTPQMDDMEGVRSAGNIMGQMFGLGKPRPKRDKKPRK
jgi:prephenate dehydrogenase